jgi:Raf kinase inhibitor-like YbhB/YbcL family protein
MLEKLPPEVGDALRNRRAGIEETLIHRLRSKPELGTIVVRSPAFNPDGPMPSRYTSDGAGVSPPLEWSVLPEQTSQVVIVVEDADSPTPHPLVHAIVVLRDPVESSIREGAINSPHHEGIGLQTGLNSYLSHAWLPPDPPPGHGPHRYVFQVFALGETDLSQSPGRSQVYEAIEHHGLGAGAVIGTYERGIRERAQGEVPEVNPAMAEGAS